MRTTQFFCTGCGFRLQAGSRFCTNCGKPLPVAPSAPHQSGSLPLGMVLGGRWTVMKQLGQGAMGAVYLVQDSRLSNRRAALKEMLDRSETITNRHEAIERFNREAETLAALTHAAIPHIYDRFTDEDRVYMVMEFVDGMNLEKLLYSFRDAHGGAIPERVAIRYSYQLAGVLDYLHKQTPPTLHRDLKPSNIILQPSGNLKLIDFGIARLFNPGSQGTGLGTQGYAAPEQYKGLAEPRTDIYALGATMHHLLTGRDPQLETPFDFPRLSQLVTVAPSLEDLIMAMLEMRPENRPSAGEVRRRIAELYVGIHDWDEDPRVLQVLGARPRPVTRRLNQPSATSPPPVPPAAPIPSPPSAPQPPGYTAPPPPGYTAPPPPGYTGLQPPGYTGLQPPTYTPAQPSGYTAQPPTYTPTPPPNYAPPQPVPSAGSTPKFCTQCGSKMLPGARFCTGCGKQYPIDPQPVTPEVPASITPVASPAPLELRVPPHLHGSQPLEYVAFDDAAEPACLLGVVKQGETEYAFVCPGPSVSSGALIEAYVQRWQGDQAFFESIDPQSPAVANELRTAWEAFRTKN